MIITRNVAKHYIRNVIRISNNGHVESKLPFIAICVPFNSIRIAKICSHFGVKLEITHFDVTRTANDMATRHLLHTKETRSSTRFDHFDYVTNTIKQLGADWVSGCRGAFGK